MNDVLRRIGGPDSISIVGCAVLAVVQGVATLLNSGVTLPDGFWPLAGASTVALGAAFAWLAFARVTVLRRAAERPLIVRTLAVFAVAFVIRAIVLDQLIVSFGVAEEPQLVARLLASAAPFGVGMPAAAYVVSLVREFSTIGELTESLRRRLAELRAFGVEQVRAQRDELEKLVTSVLRAELDALLVDAPETAVARMRAAVSEIVRPLSQRLVTSVPEVVGALPEPQERLQWRSVVTKAVEGDPFRPVRFGVWIAVLALGPTAALSDVVLAFTFPLAAGVLAGVGMWSVRALWRSGCARVGGAMRHVVFTMALALLGVGLFFALELIYTDVQPGRPLAYALMTAALGWVLAVSTSLGVEIAASRIRLDAAARELAEARVIVTTRVREQRIAISQALHGPVQDALTAASMRLATAIAADEADVQLVAHLRAMVLTSLERVAEVTPRRASLSEALVGLAELWKGVVNIRVSVSDQVNRTLRAHPTTANCLAEIVREGCANAIRHGEATVIEVQAVMSERGDTIEVSIDNDGLPVPDDAPSGVGSYLLSELTLEWSRVNLEQGARLNARVPLA